MPERLHRRQVRKRKICWPEPDRVCLSGDCDRCVERGRWLGYTTVRDYAQTDPDLLAAFHQGNKYQIRPVLFSDREQP